MSTIILNVVIILGIVIAGGFLIFFVGDLLLSIVDPNSDDRKIKAKRKKDASTMEDRLSKMDPIVADKVRSDENVSAFLNQVEMESAKELKEGGMVESVGDIDLGLPNEQKEEVNGDEFENNGEAGEAEEDEADKRLREAREALERRKAEILKRLQEDMNDDEDEDEEESDETDESSEDKHAVAVEELVEEEKIAEENEKENADEDLVEESTEGSEVEEPEAEASEEETVEEEENLEEEIESKEEPVESPAEVIEEEFVEEEDEGEEENLEPQENIEDERRKYLELIKELQEKKEVLARAASRSRLIGERDDLFARLSEKEEELAQNEKELKSCKKEYLPLYRVQKTLEKDEKKLRIKEAQVAKQKVVLYGVNNYGDIDEEKAKKLSEELDLLDGLKLSVQHCKEVMAENKDRLPILEKLYNSLQKQNESLKADIEHIKKMLGENE